MIKISKDFDHCLCIQEALCLVDITIPPHPQKIEQHWRDHNSNQSKRAQHSTGAHFFTVVETTVYGSERVLLLVKKTNNIL